jgi:hypothetical protein
MAYLRLKYGSLAPQLALFVTCLCSKNSPGLLHEYAVLVKGAC